MQAVQYQRAIDVFANELGDFFSDDDVNRLADAYEITHRQPLIRPGESDAEGRPNKKFEARVKAFAHDAPTLSGDPARFRAELRKLLERAKAKGIAKLSESEKASIHELQAALGLSLMDFKVKQRSPKQIAQEAQERFTEIVKSATSYHDRIAAIRQIADITTLQLFADVDKSEDVREAALARIAEVELSAVPGA